MSDCFVYGTLISPEIYSRVVYGRPTLGKVSETFTPAILKGYRRHSIKGVSYPGVYPAPGHQVKGLLVRGLDAAKMAKLDEFELEMYDRTLLPVETVDSAETISAYVYVWNKPSELIDEDWDYDEQIRQGLVKKVTDEFL